MNPHHREILQLIKDNSTSPGTGQSPDRPPKKRPFPEGYLGNSHPRYAINGPTLHLIAREWFRDHKTMAAPSFQKTVTSLIHGKSSTEKMVAGILLDHATAKQREFDPVCFEEWLDHLVGWAEVDTVCTGKFTVHTIPDNFATWKKILTRLSKSKNINKRRASLCLLCSPIRHVRDNEMLKVALENIERLKHEKEILITKAISWLLRSMVKIYKKEVEIYVNKNRATLPAIAVREALTKIRTGKKNPKL